MAAFLLEEGKELPFPLASPPYLPTLIMSLSLCLIFSLPFTFCHTFSENPSPIGFGWTAYLLQFTFRWV